MRAASLDRRVRTEAQALVREARESVSRTSDNLHTAVDLGSAIDEVTAALPVNDGLRVRRGLPRLDVLVDELIKPDHKSVVRYYIASTGSGADRSARWCWPHSRYGGN